MLITDGFEREDYDELLEALEDVAERLEDDARTQVLALADALLEERG
jgi:hypothetical protein